METNRTWTDSQVENAACEALGANSPEESATYQRQVAADTTGAARRLDRELRETAARLAAASPHMMPPAELRGRILQATAPTTFKMEDYRRKTREDYRFYKWGFYAAAMFLAMAALYNINIGGKLDQANRNIVAMEKRGQQIADESNKIITTFAKGDQVTWRDENGKPYGKAIVNMAAHQAVLIFPRETIPSTARPQLTLTMEDKNKVTFDTTLITASAKDLDFAKLPNGLDIPKMMNVTTLKPDTDNRPLNAVMGH